MLADGRELALIDLREELIFSQGHLLFARSVPLSRLELRFARLVPRRATRIVLCDDADGLVERAADILRAPATPTSPCSTAALPPGPTAGFELFSGVNVPSKAFGEFVEHASGTPSIAADELDRLMRDGTDMVVLDSRPFDEYQRVSIPTAVNVPGAELVLRIRDLAPSPETLVVVNCAGRTRSIIGAQSLINAGVPNKVVALRNGTMGWTLAGLACDSGKSAARRRPSRPTASPGPSPPPPRVARPLRRHAHRSRARSSAGAPTATAHALSARRARSGRIRGRARCRRRLRAGRAAGAGDRPICRHARRAHRAGRRRRGARGHDRVLAAADGLGRRVRAGRGRRRDRMAGERPSWARRRRPNCASMAPALPRCSRGTKPPSSISRSAATTSRRTFPAPGSRSARGSRTRFAKIPLRGTLVLTSEDGVLAGLAAPARRRRWSTAGARARRRQRRLARGRACADRRRPEDGGRAVDTWLKPYERPKDTTKAMQRISVVGGRSARAHRARRLGAVCEPVVSGVSGATSTAFAPNSASTFPRRQGRGAAATHVRPRAHRGNP